MDKIKLLTFSVILLLLINVVALIFCIQSNNSNPFFNKQEGRPRPDKIIIEKLHFDNKQQEEYQKLIHWHRNIINNLDAEVLKTKRELYLQLLASNVNLKIKDSLITRLVTIQKQIELTHFKHFQDIKGLCSKKQIQNFNSLTEELTVIFNHPSRKP